ncbi:MAG: Xaa-Pro aminopeptidase, partial [Candidatus Aminicenantes bacterium]|nr:Xaa-Pro aminopeptidase [Candidatus Aminicenantes bacterium]
MKKCVSFLAVLAVGAGLWAASSPSAAGTILPLKDRHTVQDRWLGARLETVLPEIMRREAVDMWVVICREYNEDPVYLSL